MQPLLSESRYISDEIEIKNLLKIKMKKNDLRKNEAVMLSGLNADDLVQMFTDIKTEIAELKHKAIPTKPDDILTRAEVAKMLDVDLSTLHLWNKKGKLICQGIGNRVYYRRSDIDKALIKLGGSND